jgi:quercetin dioxygenase-like cupin family protein
MKVFHSSDHVESPADPRNFTGRASVARIDRLSDQPTVNMYRVRFQSSARTAWHAHTGVQLLLVIEGRCRVQKRGEALHRLRRVVPFALSRVSATGTVQLRMDR